ncbi:MAG: hypothetical protein QXX99_01485 [Candidatus Bathyarchaeia archaeon]
MLEEVWFYLTIIFGVATVASVVLLLIERERKRQTHYEIKQARNSMVMEKILPAGRSVSEGLAKEVKDKLRVLNIEREILSYAIRRLYEAQAEGKITPEERDSLAKKYEEDLERIKEEVARGESIIALSELERMQEEFIKTFSERLEAINRRIEELREIAGLKPTGHVVKPVKEEVKAEETKEQVERSSAQKRRRETVRPRDTEESKAEEKPIESIEGGDVDKSIEKIVAEIEKVLSRLNQIEVEE